jgi:hypothetical protein
VLRDVTKLPVTGHTKLSPLRPRAISNLTHVYTKLGLASRVQLAQEAARHA